MTDDYKPNKTIFDSGSKNPRDASSSQSRPGAISGGYISTLEHLQEEYDSPLREDLNKVTEYSEGESKEDASKRDQHMLEIIVLTVKCICEFSKRIPGFAALLPEDRITLLKGCSVEVLFLRLARKYDIKTETTSFGSTDRYKEEAFDRASMGSLSGSIFYFCQSMYKMKVDNAVYALLTAIVIFSERDSLLEPKKVQSYRKFYITCLKSYIDRKRSMYENDYCDNLLSDLDELRQFGDKDLYSWFSMQVPYKKPPPFFEELGSR